MKKHLATSLLAVALATLTCSLAYCASGDIWLAGYHLLRLKTPMEAKALQQRVDAVQARANDLLMLSNTLPKITLRKARADYGIYADGKVFMMVTAADARAAGTSTQRLAASWAQRLRVILPKATPIQH